VSGPEIILTTGGLADLQAVMTVMDDSFDPSFGEAWTASQCAGLLPMPGVWLTLAWEEDEVVGFALSRSVAGEAELLLLAVRSKAQGRGVGGLLLKDFLTTAAMRGAERVHLEVRDGNHAVRMYERAGFELAGRRPSYYSGRGGDAYDALTLARNVAAKD
jgi:[ribosomal protein S18]-alanine N-acetyltransferase